MDIRFLKNYTPNVGYLFPRNFITFSSTPAKDIVSPGIGQIFKPPSIFIPVYGLKSTHLIEKINQNGGSFANDSSNVEQSETSPQNSQETNFDVEMKSKLKRKTMSEPVQESFNHPVIKTATLNLPKRQKNTNSSFKFTVVD